MGKIELDHTGAGSGVTLSSDGTDLLLNGTAIGGGGGTALELYAENPSSPTAPSATGTNAVAIGTNSGASGIESVSIGGNSNVSGDYSIALGNSNDVTASFAGAIGLGADATGNYAFALGAASFASGLQSVAIGRDTDATSSGALAIGYQAQARTGSNATAISRSYASGTDSFAAAIANNTSTYGATGSNSVAIGNQGKATAFGAVSLGRNTQATANYSLASGLFTVASASYGVALGYEATTYTQTSIAFSAGSFSGIAGQHQGRIFAFRQRTTDATPKVLVTDGGSSGSTNDQIILPNNSAYAFHGTIVARQQASTGTACAAWKIEGLIRREGSAGTTVLVNSATTVLDNTPAWGMALSADTTNGGLKIEATGAAATNIAWSATINTSEVTY